MSPADTPAAVTATTGVSFPIGADGEGACGFAVRDERRRDFATIEAIRAQRDLKIGVLVSVDFMHDRIRD